MALPAGRVGVKKTDVDWKGNVKGGGGSSDTYTKQQIDNKFGGLTFRDNEGTPQVKTSEGDWVNFNSGASEGLDCSSVAPELTDRNDCCVVSSVIKDADTIIFYSKDGTNRTDDNKIGELPYNGSPILLTNAPILQGNDKMGIRLTKNGTTVSLNLEGLGINVNNSTKGFTPSWWKTGCLALM